jgi:hypothetical protein
MVREIMALGNEKKMAQAGKIKDAVGRGGKCGHKLAINPQPLKTAGYVG